jgi:hypothetical protein
MEENKEEVKNEPRDGMKGPFSPEEYVINKLPHVREKIVRIQKIKQLLINEDKELKELIKSEVEILRQVTGINHLTDKVKMLSEAANEALLGEKDND